MCTISGADSAWSHRSGKRRLSRPEQVFVVVDLELRVVAALEEDLVAAQLVRLGDLLLDLLEREDVPLFVVRGDGRRRRSCRTRCRRSCS